MTMVDNDMQIMFFILRSNNENFAVPWKRNASRKKKCAK